MAEAQQELQAAAERAAQVAVAAGAADAEAYALQDAGREVRVHGGEVESLTAATERGVGVRAWIGGRVGYAYGTDLSVGGLEAVGSRAAEGAALADEDDFAAPPMPEGGAPDVDGLVDPSLEGWETPRVIDVALQIERTALGADSRIAGVEQAVYADSDQLVALHSSAGMRGAFRATSAYAYLQALAQGDGGGRETGLGFGLARGPAGLDPEAIGAEGAERAVSMIGAGKPESRTCPVVLDTTVAASFAGLIGGTLGADGVQRGRSPFAELLGEEVAAETFVLRDDGLDPGGLASAPFDGEGVARRRTDLIEGGRLRTFLHDTYTARRTGDGASSTGSAGRGSYRSQPSVSASNLVVGTGDLDLAGLLGQADGGVYVTDVAGLHSGVNPVTGVFSVGASGREIEGGELGSPVREFTIAGDLVGMLRSVTAAGAEARWVPFGGSVLTPALLIGALSVSGN
jgi:PmbA protein